MSVKKQHRWRSDSFFKTMGRLELEVEWFGGQEWQWVVRLLDSGRVTGRGTEPTEKQAKLAATRFHSGLVRKP